MAIDIGYATIDIRTADYNSKIGSFPQGTSLIIRLTVLNDASPLTLTDSTINGYVISYSKLDGKSIKYDLGELNLDSNGKVIVTGNYITKDANKCAIVLKITNGTDILFTTPLYYYVNYNPAYELEDNTTTE